MSDVIDGVLYRGEILSSDELAKCSMSGSMTVQLEAAPGIYFVGLDTPRARATKSLECIAILVSRVVGESLLILYDSRIGERAARHYRQGSLVRAFSEQDEIYVELDDVGEPISNGAKYVLSELRADGEYETVCNAIELALAETKWISWPNLKNALLHG